jgi:AcrR family transcriptional regulator
MPAAETRRSGLKQERSREARRKLARAANQLWAEKGFEDTSVSEICRVAGIPRANFYFYFPSREDLLLEMGLQGVESVGEAMGAALDQETTDEALRRVVDAFVRIATATPKPLLARIILQLMTRAEDWTATRGDQRGFYMFLTDLVALAHERGELGDGIREVEVAQALGAVLREGLLVWAREQVGDRSLDEILYRRMRIVLNGASLPLHP